MIFKRGLILLFLFLLASCESDDPVDCEQDPLDEACYVTYDEVKGNLVWAEEFDYTGLPDPEVWNYDLGAGGWGNNEIQTYTDSIANAEVQDGMLHIRALRQEQRGMPFYTSARLKTRFKADFLYGRIEVRAKLPNMLGPRSAMRIFRFTLRSTTSGYTRKRMTDFKTLDFTCTDDSVYPSYRNEIQRRKICQ